MATNQDGLRKLAALIRERNAIDADIAQIIDRPAEKGHVGEYIASELFDIDLEENATNPGYDGRFRGGPLSGKSVNIKWYAKREGLLDINESHLPDYFLVLAGPKATQLRSVGSTRPWLIAEVFLLEAGPLLERLRERGVKIGVATSVRTAEWEEARIYPGDGRSPLPLSDMNLQILSEFGDHKY